jgi:two-component system CheB/CheR fusion protein
MISAAPLFTENGQIRGAIGAIVDMSQHKQAEKHQLFLLHELQHRVKNILATISSLAIRMSRSSFSVEQFRSGFLSRLAAMGRMHDLLAGGTRGGANLQSLINAALEPYVSGHTQVRLNGDDLMLAPTAAATMGMVLHELATNAAKYGALSVPEGRVEIAWRIADEEADKQHWLRLGWTEEGGPPVDPSSPRGFGTGFITRSVEYELSGRATINLAADGLRCIIEFPLTPAFEPSLAKDD